MMRTPRAQSGFTLLEVLVAVTVTAILLMGVYGVFTSVSGAKQRLEEESKGYHQARVLYDRLGRELRGVYWQETTQPRQDERRPRLLGGRSEDGFPFLELTTTAGTPFSGGRGGISVVRYELRPDDEAAEPDVWMLVRYEYSTFDPQGSEREGYRLVTGIEDFFLRFNTGGQWVEQWDSADGNRLPQMVEVSITLPIGERTVPFSSTFEVGIQ